MARLKKINMDKAMSEAVERNTRDLKKSFEKLRKTEAVIKKEAIIKKGVAAQKAAVHTGIKHTAVSFTNEEYDFIKLVFETKGKGMKVATGIKIAALYVAERLDSGYIAMSRAGVSERR